MNDLAILCEPSQFAYNPDTAASNYFMSVGAISSYDAVQQEFKQFKETLTKAGIPFHVLKTPGTDEAPTPDAVFVNNWFCYMPSGSLTVFPMKTANRGRERNNADALKVALETAGFPVKAVNDLSHYEKEGRALESTGSMVFDHAIKTIFAVISERTDPKILEEYAKQIDYDTCTFHAVDKEGHDIYHTNVVMMGLAKHVVACLETIKDGKERQCVVDAIKRAGKTLVEITLDQMYHFCGNCIDLHVDGRDHLLMSQTAWDHFTTAQQQAFKQDYAVHPLAIPTIEGIGGGSVRCMVGKISALI